MDHEIAALTIQLFWRSSRARRKQQQCAPASRPAPQGEPAGQTQHGARGGPAQQDPPQQQARSSTPGIGPASSAPHAPGQSSSAAGPAPAAAEQPRAAGVPSAPVRASRPVTGQPAAQSARLPSKRSPGALPPKQHVRPLQGGPAAQRPLATSVPDRSKRRPGSAQPATQPPADAPGAGVPDTAAAAAAEPVPQPSRSAAALPCDQGSPTADAPEAADALSAAAQSPPAGSGRQPGAAHASQQPAWGRVSSSAPVHTQQAAQGCDQPGQGQQPQDRAVEPRPGVCRSPALPARPSERMSFTAPDQARPAQSAVALQPPAATLGPEQSSCGSMQQVWQLLQASERQVRRSCLACVPAVSVWSLSWPRPRWKLASCPAPSRGCYCRRWVYVELAVQLCQQASLKASRNSLQTAECAASQAPQVCTSAVGLDLPAGAAGAQAAGGTGAARPAPARPAGQHVCAVRSHPPQRAQQGQHARRQHGGGRACQNGPAGGPGR